MEAFEENISHSLDHCLDRIIGGFVTEVTVDTFVSYKKVERRFFKELHGRYLRSLNTWNKTILCENRIMKLPLCLELCEVERSSGIGKEQALNLVC